MKKLNINPQTPLNDGKQVFKIGFWGTGPKNLYGNIYFAQIAQGLGVPLKNFYVQNGGVRALTDFFSTIDLNRNRKLSAAEVGSLEVEVYGYSWGAIAAIGFCQLLGLRTLLQEKAQSTQTQHPGPMPASEGCSCNV